jgi:cystathionine beta-lyase/cystathionine gamma-synthase
MLEVIGLSRKTHPSSSAVHAGKSTGRSASEPEVAPIFASSVFRFKGLDQVEDVWTGKDKGYIYSRMNNPSVEAAEDAVNELEGGLGTVACSSGMAATAIALEATIGRGDRIVSASVLYGATRAMLEAEEKRRGVEAVFVDITDLDAVEKALKPGARVLLCESISNPMMEVADIPMLAMLAHSAGALLIVDNTFATPMLMRPFEFGADIVIHSCTKYMNGHDDVTAGTVSVSDRLEGGEAMLGALRSAKTLFGPILSPFEAWLLLRGIRTLGVRMTKHCENAAALAEELKQMAAVQKVYYPGVDAKKAGSTAQRLLEEGFGGMLSFVVEGGRPAAEKLISGLDMVTFVPSLGSFATTVSHPASTSHRGLLEEQRQRLGISEGLIRVSVGIEDMGDIIEDFRNALAGLK